MKTVTKSDALLWWLTSIGGQTQHILARQYFHKTADRLSDNEIHTIRIKEDEKTAYTLLHGELTTILAANKHEDDSDTEGEYFTFLDELLGLVALPIDEEHRQEIQQFIFNFSWDNYKDAKDKFYSLGSMYYNKLEWIKEGSSVKEFVQFANEFSDVVIAHLDKLEAWATTGIQDWNFINNNPLVKRKKSVTA